MPSLSLAKKYYGGGFEGLVRKQQADIIMEETWYNDLATRTCYFYNWDDDTHKDKIDKMDPKSDSYKYPMDIKFLANSSQTYSKDTITYHLQMKPSQKCVVPYYDEMFYKRYGAHYPCGLYVDIPDSKGEYNRWLVVAEANYNDPQFPTYELLRCDYVFRYVMDGIRYMVPGVLRSQNS